MTMTSSSEKTNKQIVAELVSFVLTFEVKSVSVAIKCHRTQETQLTCHRLTL